MALLDTLRERTARKGTAAQVDCGELGFLSLEALSPAECDQLGKNPRGLFYAACRELQKCGEVLRKEGKLFRPDEILSYVTDDEAARAMQVILDISGANLTGTDSDLAEMHLPPVQGDEEGATEIPPPSVQVDEEIPAAESSDEYSEIHPSTTPSSEPLEPDNQLSRELPQNEELAVFFGADGKPQLLENSSTSSAQLVVSDIISERDNTHVDVVFREIKSDLHENKQTLNQNTLRESALDLTEAAAYRLAEELCRAAMVR